MEITIGSMAFKTKKEAKSFFMDMLEPLPIGHQLNDIEFGIIYELLRFGKSEEWLNSGGGIVSMYVDDNTYGGKCFHTLRRGGSIDRVSVPKCISGEPSFMNKFTQATRRAVNQDIIDFRNKHWDSSGPDELLTCSLTGQKITRENANVDHEYPMTFSRIRDDFISSLRSRGVSLDAIEFRDKYGYIFADQNLANEFREFHRERAVLRIIRKDYNMIARTGDPRGVVFGGSSDRSDGLDSE